MRGTVRGMTHSEDPPPLHRRLKARAAEHGLTVPEYLLREAERSIGKPTIEELTERIRARRLPTLKTNPADLIRADRDRR